MYVRDIPMLMSGCKVILSNAVYCNNVNIWILSVYLLMVYYKTQLLAQAT